MTRSYTLFLGDALEVMDGFIKKGIVFDAIIADIPYGVTAAQWDEVIPLNEMWDRLNKLAKDENTPIVLFGQQPFTSRLINSNIENFKFVWYYKKRIASNFASAKYQPMKHIEEICVFTKSGKRANYFPIMQERADSGTKRIEAGFHYNSETPNETMGNIKRNNTEGNYDPKMKYPENIQEFNNRAKGSRGLHPTQKPIELMEYLVKSHTQKGDTILDFTMGSGSTGVAAILNDRKFVGIEKDIKYYNIASERLQKNTLKDERLD